MEANTRTTTIPLGILLLLTSLLLSACNGRDEVVFEGDFPIAFVQRDAGAVGDPLDPPRFVPGGDLYLLERASASASRTNLTGEYTRGAGDVTDPAVSYDGNRLLFTMRGPDDSTWNLWEYVIDRGELRRLIADDAIAEAGNDLAPNYLPDGRIVFTSDRQPRTRELLEAEGREPYTYLDEYQRQPATVLHVMEADGSDIRQISFNLSHDRDPTVLSSGEILYSRWDNSGSRSQQPLYLIRADGTGQRLHYGAFSPGNSFTRPRELPDGRLVAAVMPLAGTHQGGALALIDAQHYADAEQPVDGGAANGDGGQRQPTVHTIPLDGAPSAYGRFSTPAPVWDHNNLVLTAFTPYRPAFREHPLTGEAEAAEGRPVYGIYVFDIDARSLRPIVLAPRGRMLSQPVAVLPRPAPTTLPDYTPDPSLAAAANGLGGTGMGLLNLRSVYDPGFLDLDDDRVLVAGEELPRTATGLIDLEQLRDPERTLSAADRPARFIRISRGIPLPPGLPRAAIGNTDYPMQQVLGYVQIEPDGSAQAQVPADVPLLLAVTDVHGQAIQQLGWLQLRPGEVYSCDGCYRPRAFAALNPGNEGGSWEGSRPEPAPQPGESMAETLNRYDSSIYLPARQLRAYLSYRDVWTHPDVREPDPAMNVVYEEGPGGVLKETAVPRDGIINYPQHIQYGIWERPRPSGGNLVRCIDCHSGTSPAGGLDLDRRLGGLDRDATEAEIFTGTPRRLASYDALTVGAPLLDPTTGLPQQEIRDGRLVILREPPLIETGGPDQGARSSHLMERLLERELRSSRAMPEADPVACSSSTWRQAARCDHSDMLNEAEIRLLAEWLDNGAQYYNDPYWPRPEDTDDGSPRQLSELRWAVHGLDREAFIDRIHPILLQDCAACHQPPDSDDGRPDLGAGHSAGNRLILTGDPRGDFNAVRAQLNDLCSPPDNELLQRPSAGSGGARPHPNRAGSDAPALDPEGAAYAAILDWLTEAASAGDCP